MTSTKIGIDAKERIRIITSTGNGFEVAEKDLELRGPGDIEGTRQSGAMALRLADLVKDKIILEAARVFAEEIVKKDFQLESADNLPLKYYLMSLKGKTPWSKIS
jgi:ATP-dependent DNA helicase RecG